MAYTTTAAPPAPSAPPKIKPSAGWVVFGILLIVAGIAGAIALFVAGFFRMSDTIEGFGRFAFDSDVDGWTVEFENSGTYTIYYEWESEVDGRTISGDEDPPRGLEITVTDESGEEIELDERDVDETYELPDFSGRALYEIDIDESGSFRFDVQTREENPDDFAIAIGKGALASIVPFVLGGVGVGLLGVILGVLMIVITLVKRKRFKRRAAASASAYLPGYGPYAGAGWGPPGAPAPGVPGAAGPPGGYAPPPAPSPWPASPTASSAPTPWVSSPPATEAPAPWVASPPATDAASPWAASPPTTDAPSPWAPAPGSSTPEVGAEPPRAPAPSPTEPAPWAAPAPAAEPGAAPAPPPAPPAPAAWTPPQPEEGTTPRDLPPPPPPN
jgi:hypothetical protein